MLLWRLCLLVSHFSERCAMKWSFTRPTCPSEQTDMRGRFSIYWLPCRSIGRQRISPPATIHNQPATTRSRCFPLIPRRPPPNASILPTLSASHRPWLARAKAITQSS